MRIENDVYDIAARLKEIDERYQLYRNPELHRFEIHADGALQIAVPFDRLDARTLDLALETRKENADKLLSKLERDNMRLIEARERDARDRAAAIIEEAI